MISELADEQLRQNDIREMTVPEKIIEFMRNSINEDGQVFFRSREIADAIGLTIYQIHAHLTLLQDAGIVERVNIGRGRPGVWILK